MGLKSVTTPRRSRSVYSSSIGLSSTCCDSKVQPSRDAFAKRRTLLHMFWLIGGELAPAALFA